LFIVNSVFIIFLITACDPVPAGPTPTPNPIYFPGCSEANLIGHIGQANTQPGPDVIHLDPGCVYTLEVINNTTSADAKTVYSGLPIIISPITIYGNNAVIDIQPAENVSVFGHFFIDPIGDLELYDLTLENGSRPLGGSVINIGGDFFASNVTFSNNKAFPAGQDANARGGAIYNNSGRVRVINSCHFEQNKAGHLNYTGDDQGGAIYSENGTLVVSSSTFQGNNANGEGGAIYSRKNQADESGGLVSITDSEFGGNYALQNGGAIALIDEIAGVFITESKLEENSALHLGGAIFATGTDLSGQLNDFILNQASYGGAVYTQLAGEGTLSSYSSESTMFNNNHADIGGGVYSENSELSLDDSYIVENFARSCAGLRIGGPPDMDVLAGDLETATRIASTARIVDSSFSFNVASDSSGGGACHVMGDLTIKDSSFYSNSAEFGGGGLIIHDKADLSGIEFFMNSADVGGGLLVGYPIRNFTEGNSVSPLYMTFTTTVSGSGFVANDAVYGGGGIYAHHRGSLIISKTYFRSNATSFDGGAMRLEEGDTFIRNSSIGLNSATKGGGIYAEGSHGSLEINHATFAGNIASETSNGGDSTNKRWGGGGLNVGGTATVENSLFADNSSMDCQLDNGMNYSAPGTYSTDHTCAGLIEPNPVLGPFVDNGGGTLTFPLLSISPLIDVLPNCGLPDDQRGVTRHQGAACEPGSYEFDPENPFGPGLDDWQTVSLEPDDCDPFAGMDVSVMTLGMPEDTMALPVVLRADYEIPGLNPESMNGSPLYVYRALLGDNKSYQCGLQGFPDRLYCMIKMASYSPGMALDFLLYLNDCEEPVFIQSLLSIPEPYSSGDPSGQELTCTADLLTPDCEAAGGYRSTGLTTAPKCVCP